VSTAVLTGTAWGFVGLEANGLAAIGLLPTLFTPAFGADVVVSSHAIFLLEI
jgi:hypothetical protein